MLSNLTSGIGGLITSVKGNKDNPTTEETGETTPVNKSRSGSTSGGVGEGGGASGWVFVMLPIPTANNCQNNLANCP